MKPHSSRRSFLQAGLTLPAAGLVASRRLRASSLPAAGVTYRTLGKTGLKVTSVGFGCGFTPDPSVMARAVDMGINYFDTARVYGRGNSERLVGVALKGLRDKVVLVSKSVAKAKAAALADLDASLKALGTDRLDIWLMHARDKPEQIPDEAVAAWETAKRQGKTRFTGVSTHDPAAVVDHILKIGKFDVVLFTYNFTMGASRDAAIAKLRDAGIGLVAMKVMAPAGGGEGKGRVKPMLTKDGPLAALKWVLKNPAVSTTIPSMSDTDQLEMNFRAMSENFSPQDEKLLAARCEEIRPLYCRMCYQCSGKCPKGLPVTDVLRFLAYADFYGDFPLARGSFQELPKELRKVRCRDCSSCAVHCPNGVRVTDRLIRAQELLA